MPSQDRLTLAFVERRPESAAQVLHEIEPEEAAEFLGGIPSRVAAAALEYMVPRAAARCLCLMGPERAAQLLGAMHAPAASGLLRIADPARTAAILEWLPTRTARGLRQALEHPVGTVGAWTDRTMAAFLANNTVREALSWITAGVEAEPAHVFVVDAGQRPLGAVSAAALSIAPRRTPLGALLRREVKPLFANLRLIDVAGSPTWDHYLILPVTDAQGRMIGGLSRGAMRRGLEQEPAPGHAIAEDSIFVQLLEAFLASTSQLTRTLLPDSIAWARPRTSGEKR